MSTLFRNRPAVSRFLIASVWLLVASSDLAGSRVVKCNIQLVVQRHEERSRPQAQQLTTV